MNAFEGSWQVEKNSVERHHAEAQEKFNALYEEIQAGLPGLQCSPEQNEHVDTAEVIDQAQTATVELITQIESGRPDFYELHQQIGCVYRAWQKQALATDSLETWVRSVKSDVTEKTIAEFGGCVTDFLYTKYGSTQYIDVPMLAMRHDGRLYTTDQANYDLELYTLPPDPVAIATPSKSEILNHIDLKVLDRSVIREIITLIESGEVQESDLYHSTNTAALSGIAQSGALVASSQLEDDSLLVTGEVNDSISMPFDTQKSRRRLSDVYTSQNKNIDGYFFTKWFDQSPIVFGINRAAQEQYLAEIQDNPDDWVNGIRDFGTEGVLVGPKVPMEHIQYVYCNAESVEQVTQWAAEHCSTATVVNREVTDALYFTRKTITKIAEELSCSELAVWQMLEAEGGYRNKKY